MLRLQRSTPVYAPLARLAGMRLHRPTPVLAPLAVLASVLCGVLIALRFMTANGEAYVGAELLTVGVTGIVAILPRPVWAWAGGAWLAAVTLTAMALALAAVLS